ncbi:MAG: threonine--tRNA ligase [Bdellovibrionota bacterium]
MAEANKISDFDEREIANELDRLRHSTAHVMAHAVKRLYPQAKFGIGPTIEDGFYYDIWLDTALTPEDLPRIEAEMKKIIKDNNRFERDELSVEKARELFTRLDQPLKLEIIRDLGGSTFSVYQEGEFVDLCRGPHIESTGQIKAFKLLSIAGAYWRGKQENQQLQRIYGTAFYSQKELDEHLHLIEEAKKRDHRKLGRELDLFSFDPVAPGSPFFHPKGTLVYNRLVQFVRELYRPFNYQEIITPQIIDSSLWHRSGHYENYKENMYFTEIEEREFAVKPMNCPASTFVYASNKRSYRDLPLRLADFGRLHRYEKSGAIGGLTRVRTFCQDDAHVFCTPEQIEPEVISLIDMILGTYEVFGFGKVDVFLSTRPEKRVGSDQLWDTAEKALAKALDTKGKRYQINPGDGAFYGPKIDFIVHDALKRPWQLGTIQLDFNMPERFQLEYTGADNSAHRPVMIHRAVLGSVERFMGVLIEHYAGAFPFWLAPVQCMVISINPDQEEYCRGFLKTLREKGIRAEYDGRNESMGLKTREAQMQKIPLMFVAGKREVETDTFSVRKYSEKTSTTMTKDALLEMMLELEAAGKPKA